jgi:hypothetical protein
MTTAAVNKQNSILCVLVADEALAKLMLQNKPGARLVEMQALSDPQAHPRERAPPRRRQQRRAQHRRADHVGG